MHGKQYRIHHCTTQYSHRDFNTATNRHIKHGSSFNVIDNVVANNDRGIARQHKNIATRRPIQQ